MKSTPLAILCLLLLTLPAVVEAQYYTTNTDGVTLTLAQYYDVAGVEVIIPDSVNGLPVTGIGDGAFQFCSSLRSVTFGNSVTNVGEGAFSGCSSLVAIIAAAQNPVYSTLDGVLFNKSLTVLVAFPPDLIFFTIPDSVTAIGDGAFSNCVYLAFLTMGNSVTNIGNSSFYGCYRLTSVTLPNSVITIGDSAFYSCYGLTNMTLPNGVTAIGDSAFYDCFGLTMIPNSVTNIGESAFAGCRGLTNVTIPDGVTTIGANAFYGCGGLTNVTLPASVTTIGEGAFYGCNLSNVTIPDGVTAIGDSAFSNNGLTSVTIADSVTNIGGAAFSECQNLTNLIIGSGVISIGDRAFFECTNLRSVFFLGNPPATGTYTFDNDASLKWYYLPGATGWSSFFLSRQVLLWNPVIQTSDGRFGLSNNQFGFNITGTAKIPIVVEACTNLANPVWAPLQSLKLTNGSFYFSDAQWTNYPARYYRISAP